MKILKAILIHEGVYLLSYISQSFHHLSSDGRVYLLTSSFARTRSLSPLHKGFAAEQVPFSAMRMPGCQPRPQPGWTRHPLPAVGLSFGNTEQRMRSGNVALCPGEEPLMTGPCQDCNFMAFSSRRGRNDVLKMTQPCLVFLEVVSGVMPWAWSSQSFTK